MPIHLIKLSPPYAGGAEYPRCCDPQPSRFTYDPTEAAIVMSGKKKFSRIFADNGLYETEETPTEEVPPAKEEKWRGDLTPIHQSLHLRASQDLFCGFRYGSEQDLSWTEASLLQDMEQFLLDQSCKLLEKDMGGIARESAQEKISRLK